MKPSWIETISYEKAQGKLKKLYDRIKGPDNNIDNIMLAHSLRPHSLTGHMALYKNVLHHSSNSVDKWFLEAIGVYVSLLNGCEYCYRHHFEGMKRLLQDEAKAQEIWEALAVNQPERSFEGRELAVMAYSQKLTQAPATLVEADIEALRAVGLEDGEILEINQVISYFAYANRTVLGLGVTTAGDILGLSPNASDDPDNWQHQ